MRTLREYIVRRRFGRLREIPTRYLLSHLSRSRRDLVRVTALFARGQQYHIAQELTSALFNIEQAINLIYDILGEEEYNVADVHSE